MRRPINDKCCTNYKIYIWLFFLQLHQFVSLMAQKLKPGGILHLATDWQHYADHMLQVLSEHRQFHNMAADNQFMPRPDFRPLTKYEQRGLKLGHKTWDLIFKRLYNEPLSGSL